MKKKILILLVVILAFISLCSYADILDKSLVGNNTGNTLTTKLDPKISSVSDGQNFGIFYAISYGTLINFVEGTGEARVANESVIKGEGNQLKVIGTGRCDVTIKSSSKETPYSFFAWNYKVKGGQIDVYQDSSLSNKVGTLYGECYLVGKEEGNAIKIVEYLYSSGHGDIDVKDKYFSKSASSTYLEDSTKGTEKKIFISLQTFSFVKPVTKTIQTSASAGGTSGGASEFLNICKQTIMYLNKYGYGYKSGGLSIPPYPGGGSMADAPKSSTHNVDCVDYVRWSLYEYGKTKGITAFTESSYTTSYIPSFHSLATKMSEGKDCDEWMKKFNVVYVSANHDTGLGRESGMTIEKIKSMLQPGDILVYTGGPRFTSAGNSNSRVDDMHNNHIDVFAGFSGEDSNGNVGVLVYSCGDAPSSHSEYSSGSPIAMKYSLTHNNDAHGFWDVTVVLRLNV